MRKIAIFFMLLPLLVPASVGEARSGPEIEDKTLAKPKQVAPMTADAINYLNSHANDNLVKVWVFFTDKGVFNRKQFDRASGEFAKSLSPRALARRAKHGASEAKITDLPVYSSYVDRIVSTGAKLRRISRWLNAASFEVEISKLRMIQSFQFVERIQPVALFKKDYEQVSSLEKQDRSQISLGPQALSYGSSSGQLTQINVPVCHDSGYTGAGVIIAVFDTGFRKTHNSFAQAYADSRVLFEHDFIFNDGNVSNEPIDDPSAWNHGTSTWSTVGGENPGIHYGPSFDASFILCKTEDVRSETPVEEDNWVAAMEWVDGLGADIISSSLGYSDWYTTSDYDGNTCVTTVAADIAAENGILVCNSAGNSGPGASTLSAPADADSILTVGAVNSGGSIASFSSRGPTLDGRIKPEVCAQGVSCYLASSGGDASYGYGSGTSFSCPLTAGVAGIVMSAHPSWTNMQVREAMMMTASRASTPDNTYGWGILNAWAATQYSFGPPVYTPGDANGSGIVNISDVVYIIAYVFSGGPVPNPAQSGDANCNGEINVADAVHLVQYIFNSGPAPC